MEKYFIYTIYEDGSEALWKNPIPNLEILCNRFVQDNIIRIKLPFKFGSNSKIILRGKNATIELFSTALGSNFLLQTGVGVTGQKLYIGENVTAGDNFNIYMVSSNRGVYSWKRLYVFKKCSNMVV